MIENIGKLITGALSLPSVKGGLPNDYPDITYESAFENYFSHPSWKSAGKDEEGNEVVKFTAIVITLMRGQLRRLNLSYMRNKVVLLYLL